MDILIQIKITMAHLVKRYSILQIKKIFLDKKIPIIVGGTGLYLEFISKGISNIPNISAKNQKKVEKIIFKKKENKYIMII